MFMTIVGRTFDELKSLLEDHGYIVVCSDFFIEQNRIVCEKDGETFALQYMKFYNYRFIIKLFRSLELDPPEDCLHVLQQDQLYIKNNRNDKGE